MNLPNRDLNDAEWAEIEVLIPPEGRRKTSPRDLVNAILYRYRTDCSWPTLPEQYPQWQTVQYNALKWEEDGTLNSIVERLHEFAFESFCRSKASLPDRDLDGAEWTEIKALIPPSPALRTGGRLPKFRYLVNAVLYKLRTDCCWDQIPKRYPPWGTVLRYYSLWKKDGTLARIVERLQAVACASE